MKYSKTEKKANIFANKNKMALLLDTFKACSEGVDYLFIDKWRRQNPKVAQVCTPICVSDAPSMLLARTPAHGET